jgi:ribosomal protein S18 acetylase RimI-like enzyme
LKRGALAIFVVEHGPRIDAARALFREYLAAFADDASFRACIAPQGVDAEVAGLPGDYAAPRGALLLAEVDGEVAGCIAMKPLAGGDCEMKRLWLRPGFRGRGAGETLVRALLARARAAGYRRMLLDTLPSMAAAQALYRRLGFVEIEKYNRNPAPDAVFFARDLGND